jgi:hypothetical protein
MNWRLMSRVKISQRDAVAWCLVGKKVPAAPVVVTITRIGPRKLDSDNLASACKYVRDAVAIAVGEDDGSDLYTWVYKQQTGKIYGVDIEITAAKC